MKNHKQAKAVWHAVNSLEHPSLSSGQVHIWKILLNEATEFIRVNKNLLSDDERGRASKYHFERDRKRFSIGRGILRTLLGSYLGISPGNIEFIYGEHGKPKLDSAPIQFNMSYSREMVLYAFSSINKLGIDIEYKYPHDDLDDVARSHFSYQEIDELQQLPERDKLAGFYNCWTRKEAYIKAIGDGLAYPLEKFTVSLIPGAAPELIHIDKNPDEIHHWSLFSFMPGEGFQAALIVKGHGHQISYWQFHN